jgi:type I restriction enzyme S subunit
MAVWSKINVLDITKNKRIDSEFFHPKYIIAETTVTNNLNVSFLGKLGEFVIGPFGSAFHVNNYDRNSSYQYIRGKDVKPFKLQEDDNVYIPEKDYQRLSKYAVKEGDLIISVVGTLGNVAIVPKDVKGIFSCKSTIFRNISVDPFFLLTYLNSKIGRDCLLRRQRGAIQTGLNKEDLKTVPVPIFDSNIQVLCGNKVREALRLSQTSKSLFAEATNLLEEELHLNSIQFKKQNTFTVGLDEVISERRMNAEYFSPQIKEILSHPFLKNSKKLGEIFHIVRGLSPSQYYTSGIPVIKTKNIRVPEIDEDKISDFIQTKSNFVFIKENDLLLASMGVGSLGRISFISNLKKEFIIDGTLRILRRRSNTAINFVVPTMLFLTSKVGQELLYRGIVGSTGIISLPDDYLMKIPIPSFSTDLCKEITDLVMQSILAKMESKYLLAQAKTAVESLIENAAINAS